MKRVKSKRERLYEKLDIQENGCWLMLANMKANKTRYKLQHLARKESERVSVIPSSFSLADYSLCK